MQKHTNFARDQELEETIEILQAQIESLELELCYKNYELEALKQELKYTNQELSTAINSQQLTFAQAEELARYFLATEKPIKDILVKLLTAIYNVPIKPDVLAQTDKFCFTSRCGEIESAA
ncbi:MAG: hypothetical protein JO235_00355 [Chroococcidiopsidaceae cyanobacterium CP_BM_RX_35]|nr:hypothetical protein [Chroococcidiopsidaceae cyanobacterium CP_BM_RX_35]